MKLALLGAAALAVTALVTPANAQAVIDNPGKCAQYYPNANCENLGPGNPYTGGYRTEYGAYQPGWRGDYASMRRHHRHYRRHHH